jgi:hypothetical protein
VSQSATVADDENCDACGMPITDDDEGVLAYRKAPANDLATAFEQEVVDTEPCCVHQRCFNDRDYLRA